MKRAAQTWTAIALGGSIVRPDGLNTRFVRRFRQFLLPFLKRDYRFVIVVGGGRLAREYQEAAKRIVRVTDDDLDWIGIHATRINAHFLRTVFRKEAYPVIIDNPEKPIRISASARLLFASGSRPGWSTDYIAARLAHKFGTKTFIIAGKPSYVYDKDHAEFDDARPIPILTWAHYRKICGGSWRPGLHAPVDPVAARFAREHRMEAIVVKGSDLENLGRVLRGEPFAGSVILP